MDKGVSEFGRDGAGSVLTQIARYSPILNQSTGLSNKGFTCAFFHRTTGSLTLLFHTNGSIDGAGLTTCPATKRNGDPCGKPLKEYEHLIECPSHGFRFYLHSSKLEDVIYACYRDALQIELTEGKADVCKNDDKRKDNPGNLLKSIAATIGISNEETQSLVHDSQPDGVTVYGLYLDCNEFPIHKRGRAPLPGQNVNSLERRKEALKRFLAYCRQHKLCIEFWDVHFCQGLSKNLRTNEVNKKRKYRKAFRAFIDCQDEEFKDARDHMRFLNKGEDAPWISLFGMCLSGALSDGAW